MGTGIFGWDVGGVSSKGTTHKPEDRLHSGYDRWAGDGSNRRDPGTRGSSMRPGCHHSMSQTA